MRNKVFIYASVLLLATSVSAASKTYQSSFPGINGPVAVQVSIDGKKITKVEVTKHKETSGVGSVAVDQLPDRIVKHQSVAVDTVSGASLTSNAIIGAVKDCLEQAGLDPEKYEKKIVSKPVNQTLQYDFVVVGAGGAGMTAALRADQYGIKTLLLEKMDIIGGAFAIHGGAMVLQGSKVQRDKGITEDSPNAMVHDFLANGHFKNDLPKLMLYANNVGQTVDWLVDYVGVRYDTTKEFRRLAEYSYNRVLYYKGGTGGLIKTYTAALKRAKNVTVMTGTRVEDLIMKSNKVVGVKATKKDGSKLTVKAKAVLLSTGGFGNNKEMLVEPGKSALYYGPICAMGDGHKMAMKVGAKMANMELAKLYPNGVEVSPGFARSTSTANDGATKVSAILVDSNCNRVVNERASNNTIKTRMMKDPKREFFLVMDEASFQGFLKSLNRRLMPLSDVERWIADDGKHVPLFVKADTLEAVAKKAKLNNPENLKKTVERYNQFVKNGRDDDFGRPTDFLKQPISDVGPYYILEQKPRFATTLGGVSATQEMEALSTNGKTIRNLFVAGEVTNMVQGDDSPVGANSAWAVTSGKYVADVVAKRFQKTIH